MATFGIYARIYAAKNAGITIPQDERRYTEVEEKIADPEYWEKVKKEYIEKNLK